MEALLVGGLAFLLWCLSGDGKAKLKNKHHLRNITEDDYNKPVVEIIEKTLGCDIEDCQYHEDDRTFYVKNPSNQIVGVKKNKHKEQIDSVFDGAITNNVFEKTGTSKKSSLSKDFVEEFEDLPVDVSLLMDIKFEKEPDKLRYKKGKNKKGKDIWNDFK